eukprot:gnl/Carplike_NY0171/3778_a5097_253.p1 GENE.gnl/Carplike_NY0171/3778_a5097_253~~gnl/Carplike_NY0171/3778_a5097_253.p1  ORF type:complete len:316 (+),score=50.53 gnl/Carplike_NY0171/3778_a5097_253:148-1095(+)
MFILFSWIPLIRRFLRRIELKMNVLVLSTIPTRFMSRLVGKLMSCAMPRWLLRLIINFWVKTFGVKLDEMLASSIDEFSTVNEFFTRPLRPGVRTIGKSPIVAPADSRFVCGGQISELGKIPCVKGLDFTVEDILSCSPELKHSEFVPTSSELPTLSSNPNLYFCVMYLSPGDYHRYHTPCEFNIKKRIHSPGRLVCVNEPFMRYYRGTLAVNERLCLHGTWKGGFMGYIAVGALNVGSMSFTVEPSFISNSSGSEKMSVKEFSDPVRLGKGEEVGMFNLGSTIVLVFESKKHVEFLPKPGDKLNVGQDIVFIRK